MKDFNRLKLEGQTQNGAQFDLKVLLEKGMNQKWKRDKGMEKYNIV